MFPQPETFQQQFCDGGKTNRGGTQNMTKTSGAVGSAMVSGRLNGGAGGRSGGTRAAFTGTRGRGQGHGGDDAIHFLFL